MKYCVCAVYDEAAQCFGRPIFTSAIGAAVRSLADEINRAAVDNQMFHHPSDFRLFHLGSFDDASGMFDLLSRPEKIADGVQLKILPTNVSTHSVPPNQEDMFGGPDVSPRYPHNSKA